jgi:hypothetical protein
MSLKPGRCKGLQSEELADDFKIMNSHTLATTSAVLDRRVFQRITQKNRARCAPESRGPCKIECKHEWRCKCMIQQQHICHGNLTSEIILSLTVASTQSE